MVEIGTAIRGAGPQQEACMADAYWQRGRG